MKIVEEKFGNGTTLVYRVIDSGTAYEIKRVSQNGMTEEFKHVDDALISVLEQCIASGERVRIWYGDINTGRAWNEEYDVTGTICRSCGNIKIPLLVRCSRSYGGGALLTSCLIRVDKVATHRTLWKVDNFHVEKMSIDIPSPELREDGYVASVMQTEDSGAIKNIANFKSEEKAKRWIQFMNGERYGK